MDNTIIKFSEMVSVRLDGVMQFKSVYNTKDEVKDNSLNG